ncbi:MAG: GrpB family protein [Bacteroidetes Order II. Incertae sedis bacterium]|nr:GrpB family protein [Bacteroidetes Order II. bacterium]
MTHFIEPHNPNWATEFSRVKKALSEVLHGYPIDLQHIGSTAIPDIVAKPILDIDIIIEDKLHLDGISERLGEVGYIYKGEQGIPGRFVFRQTSPRTPITGNDKEWQKHHLYVCFSDSLALKNHILFRDTLLNNQQLAQEYSQLKANLIKEKTMTKERYNQQKTAFVLSILSMGDFDENDLITIKKQNI